MKDIEDVTKLAGKCDVRLDKQEMEILRKLAENNNVTKSDIMRQALHFFHRWCTEK